MWKAHKFSSVQKTLVSPLRTRSNIAKLRYRLCSSFALDALDRSVIAPHARDTIRPCADTPTAGLCPIEHDRYRPLTRRHAIV